jgi:hypothetical protein
MVFASALDSLLNTSTTYLPSIYFNLNHIALVSGKMPVSVCVDGLDIFPLSRMLTGMIRSGTEQHSHRHLSQTKR